MPKSHNAKRGKICNGVKIRKKWKINPKTRVKESKRKYNRKKTKRQLRDEIASSPSRFIRGPRNDVLKRRIT